VLKFKIFDFFCCKYQIFDINLSCQTLAITNIQLLYHCLTRQINQPMMNEIVITPVDDEMALLANSVKILNEYKKLGFTKREAFLEVVMGEDTSYHNLSGMNKLNNFWAMRVKDSILNSDLLKILENLKES